MKRLLTTLGSVFSTSGPSRKPDRRTNRFRPGVETLEDRLVPTSLPAVPVLVANDVSSSQINLTWNKVSGATGYTVEALVNNNWTVMANMNSNYTVCNFPGVASNHLFEFRVGAYNSAGTSWSLAKQAATVLHPTTPGLPAIDGPVTYTPVNGTLFGPKGPTFLDVQQGQAGDCWLLASLAEVAARQPQLISSMFTSLGTEAENGVAVSLYDVRLYSPNGTPEHFIVDSELPTSAQINTAFGTVYDHPVGGSNAVNGSSVPVLWVALAEKAYAEYLGNSYGKLNGGDPSTAFHAIAGQSAPYSIGINPTNIASAWSHNEFIVLDSSSSPTNHYVVNDHAYALVGYNASNNTFTLFNPWGTNMSGWAPVPQSNGQPDYGWTTVSAVFLSQNFVGQNMGAEAAASTGYAARGVDILTQTAGPVAAGTGFSSAGQSVEPVLQSNDAMNHTASTRIDASAFLDLVCPAHRSVNDAFWSQVGNTDGAVDFLGRTWLES